MNIPVVSLFSDFTDFRKPLFFISDGDDLTMTSGVKKSKIDSSVWFFHYDGKYYPVRCISKKIYCKPGMAWMRVVYFIKFDSEFKSYQKLKKIILKEKVVENNIHSTYDIFDELNEPEDQNVSTYLMKVLKSAELLQNTHEDLTPKKLGNIDWKILLAVLIGVGALMGLLIFLGSTESLGPDGEPIKLPFQNIFEGI